MVRFFKRAVTLLHRKPLTPMVSGAGPWREAKWSGKTLGIDGGGGHHHLQVRAPAEFGQVAQQEVKMFGLRSWASSMMS
jgi:hypothetical protein